MTNFTVRIELHDADEGDYEDLHSAMAKKGFVRWIKTDDGERFQLPTAEYNLIDSTLEVDQVLSRAKDAAASVKPTPKPWVLVTQSGGRRWSGLKTWKA